MIYLNEDAVRRLLPWKALAAAIEHRICQRDVVAPRRLSFELASVNVAERGRLLIMPSWNAETMVGLKTVTYRPDNPDMGLPSHGASYILMDARSGTVVALLEALELTTRRTAAVSALAARHLARPASRRLLIVGSGPVAHALAGAHAALRPLESIEVYGRTVARVDALLATLKGEGIRASRCEDLEAGVKRADIICTATSSTVPLIKGEWLRPGTHVDLIGGFTPAMREVDDALVGRAHSIWVDTPAAIQESGDLVGPISAGHIGERDIAGDLATLLAESETKRRGESDITLFKAVGFAVCDFAAALLVLESATAHPALE